MRRKLAKIVVAAVALAVAVSPIAEAKGKAKKTTRTVSYEYTGPAGVEAQGSTAQYCGPDQGCFSTAAQRKERYVSIEVTDSTGGDVPFLLDVNGATTAYCGSTNRPVWLTPSAEVDVSVLAFSTACAGTATTGTITAVFSNLP